MEQPITLWYRIRHWLGFTADGPWRAKTVLLAALIALVGSGLWLHATVTVNPPAGADGPTFNDMGEVTSGVQFKQSQPFPTYAKLALSYIGGFLIGWMFRRFIALVIAVSLLVVGLLTAGHFLGWNTQRAEDQVKRTSQRVQAEAVNLRDSLQAILPSTAAGAVGAFWGFRRRHRLATNPPRTNS